ncbi:tyrosine-type recombinase/integrase [Marinobacter salarius]|nr:site-specific integrase [Marinobacter salarius]
MMKRDFDMGLPTTLATHPAGLSAWLTSNQVASIPTYRGSLASPHSAGWEAKTDIEASSLWLSEAGARSRLTAEAYERELRRFVLWLADQGRSISDVTREDFHRYAAFLGNPGKRWISTSRRKVSDPRWRPFRKALSDKGKRYSLQVVHSMYTWMYASGWIAFNPMPAPDRLAPVTASSRSDEIETRQVPQHLFEELLVFCEHELHTGANVRERYKNIRLRLILSLAGYLGARSADMLYGFFSDIHVRTYGTRIRYVWHIPNGKGRKAGVLPVPEPVMRVIREARTCLGLMPEREAKEPPCPLLINAGRIPLNRMPALPKMKGLEKSSLYTLVRDCFEAFESHLKAHSRHTDAIVFSVASSHWLRHTAIKRIVKLTNDIVIAQRLARHDSLSTTGVYAEATVEELGDVFETFSIGTRSGHG